MLAALSSVFLLSALPSTTTAASPVISECNTEALINTV